jgi:Ran GTPase-activating protein (RanGAP) involved in mRNA processing and transport
MPNLSRLDFSDTIKYRHRSDMCAGTKAMLYQVRTFNIVYLNLQDNFLDSDGARAFNEFLENNNGSLKTLNVNGCKLGNKSVEMMLES